MNKIENTQQKQSVDYQNLSWAPLRIYSEYSLLTSCIKPSDIVEYCKKNNIHSAAVTDENNMFGSMQFSLALQKAGIKPILGCALHIKQNENDINTSHIFAYCKNENGYVSLSNLLSSSYLEHNGALSIEHFNQLTDCILLIDHEITKENIAKLQKIISPSCELTISISRQKVDSDHENTLFTISNELNIPIVAAPKFHYPKAQYSLALDALWCIKNGTYLAEVDREHAPSDGFLMNPSEIAKLFEDIPQAVENAAIIAKKCNFSLKEHAPRMPGIDTTDPPEIAFKNQVLTGLEKRLTQVFERNQKEGTLTEENKSQIVEEYTNRAHNEIAMITKMGFCDYFLIVAEIIGWAKRNNVPVGPGRGSGASCLAAWCLEITNLDPMRYNLMFERFLNPDRVSLPDFDIDFCQEKRGKVIEFIQQRFGKDNVAHIITFGSLQYRAAIRDIGRVMQIPYGKTDDLCKRLPPPVQGVAPTIKELREDGRLAEFINDETKDLFMIAESIEGLPRHSSTHAAGLIIGDTKLSNIVPLFKDPALNIPIIQLSMKPAEQIGLVKFDILGLSVLSMLQKTVEWLAEDGIELDLDKIPYKDDAVFEMLQQGFVKAVFQIDSPGFRNLMLEMKPNRFEDLIAAGALYRPGPMADIPQFVRCKNGLDKVEYMYPEMENILQETYGVIVYQEQVLQIAKEMAGYALKDADLLRRAMGKKIKSEMALHEEKFTKGIVETIGGTKEKAQSLFDKLAKFASYGFAKAHAAPYGVMTYQTAYCKKHYTPHFLCATIYYEHTLEKCEEIMQEAKKMGVKILPPSLNKSKANFGLDENKNIMYGLSRIKGVGEIANQIVKEREENGEYKSINDFIKRINPNKKVLENFVKAGVFDEFADSKTLKVNHTRAEQADEITNHSQEQTISLFDFENDITPYTDQEIMEQEFATMNTVFTYKYNGNSISDLKLENFNIYTKVNDIEKAGYLFGVGVKNNTRKTKDGKILYSFQYFDTDGLQEQFSGQTYETNAFDYQILEIEKSGNRYVVRNVMIPDQYFKKFKKMFIIGAEKFKPIIKQLKEGETSIYDEETKTLLGNYQLTLDFLDQIKNHIVHLS